MALPHTPEGSTAHLPALGGTRSADRTRAPRGRVLTQVALAVRRFLWVVDLLGAAFATILAHALSPVFLGGPAARESLDAAAVYATAFVFVGYAVGL
ncbi:MAG TPA: hypothetical protein VLL75_11415, partial [Vicinamibacteria bacterium]|nr:hypothetical protein [Vicinamibacteria bacterium]